jgi:alanine-glyoxylate transaminase/serine-glyoxylate transaminase/serine-pyruvate transaminase
VERPPGADEAIMTRSGRHFLQIPGPTNVPDRVLRAMDRPVIDHRGPEFATLTQEVLERIRPVFGTTGPVVIYPSSGTGSCEAALVNTLSPGDRVLIVETGWFSHTPWMQVATRLGLDVEYLLGDWRRPASASAVEGRLHADADREIAAVVVVHNETSTGATSDIHAVRRAIDAAAHPALLVVDAISSLGSIDVAHDAWGADVTVGASQKGLMLPPGLGLNAMSGTALAAHARAGLPRSYFDWSEMLKANASGFFPYTPATLLLFGLREALAMLDEESLPAVFARHRRHGRATRAAVEAWGLEIVCVDESARSDVLTAVLLPEGHDADRLRRLILEHYDLSLGTGLGQLAGKAFRIGHLGWFNDLMLAGTLSGVEMGLRHAGVPYRAGGIMAALDSLAASPAT